MRSWSLRPPYLRGFSGAASWTVAKFRDCCVLALDETATARERALVVGAEVRDSILLSAQLSKRMWKPIGARLEVAVELDGETAEES